MKKLNYKSAKLLTNVESNLDVYRCYRKELVNNSGTSGVTEVILLVILCIGSYTRLISVLSYLYNYAINDILLFPSFYSFLTCTNYISYNGSISWMFILNHRK